MLAFMVLETWNYIYLFGVMCTLMIVVYFIINRADAIFWLLHTYKLFIICIVTIGSSSCWF